MAPPTRSEGPEVVLAGNATGPAGRLLFGTGVDRRLKEEPATASALVGGGGEGCGGVEGGGRVKGG